MYLPLSLLQHVAGVYDICCDHEVGGRLSKTILKFCYWKGLITKGDIYVKP